MKNIIKIWIACSLITLLFTACSNDKSPAPGTSDSIRVVTTLYPLYEFTKQVGGDTVSVSSVIPFGVDPHGFEPNPRNVEEIINADLIVMNGAGMEPWLDRLLENTVPDSVRVVEASAGLDLIPVNDDDDHAHDDHEGVFFNPHTWLDPINAIAQVRAIESALTEIAPSHAQEFSNNAEAYIAKLEDLNKRFSRAFENCESRMVVITHSSLPYFCRRYNLEEAPISGLAHQDEPSPREFGELIRRAREANVRVVFHESEVSPRLAETLAKEINARVLPFNTLHTTTPDGDSDGVNYIEIMKANLRRLCEGLSCDCADE
jgi:zinc transport system substrate-binding protein